MKRFLKITVAVILFISITNLSEAQVRFGIKGGLNYTSLSNIDKAKDLVDMKSGFHAGLLLNAQLPLGFALQPELLYSQKSATIDFTFTDIDFTLGYIELPINLQWGINLPGFRPFAQAGVYLGYAIKNGVSAGNTYAGEFTWDNINRIQYGVNLGVGVDLFTFLQVSLKYMWDLGPIADFDTGSFKTMDKTNYNGIQLSVGLMF